mmetsp:Transcript_3075/g.4283  ORF Transcript_3075/g.4283 Transcript_3075/m.4283 type:complete len:178 (-) Transcript_3075:3104-3637(-)
MKTSCAIIWSIYTAVESFVVPTRSNVLLRPLRTSEIDELRESVATLTQRLEYVENELLLMKEARLGALENELEALSRERKEKKNLSITSSALRSAFVARSEFVPPDPRKFGAIPGKTKNDEFLDDTLEELLEIGGDPTFLDRAREDNITPEISEERKKPAFVWDGVIDETAYFDEEL